MRLSSILFWLCLMPTALAARAPQVVTDIAPIQSLAARVMQGVGAPSLIIRPGASPHDYALRPSEAAALQGADLVIWIGPALTPWLSDVIAQLAPEAPLLTLLEADETKLLPLRRGLWFDAEGHDEEGHEEGHDTHSHPEGDGIDPHAWLDPVNGRNWLRLIADELSALDPEHADLYNANATQGMAELDQVMGDIRQSLTPIKGLKYLVYHDATQYFEARFGMPASGAVTAGDAAMPGPARIAGLREFVAREGVECLLGGPQSDLRLAQAIFPHGVQTGVLDPLGIENQDNTGLYRTLFLDLAKSYLGCVQ